jgi:phosphoribosylformimino-5-aminoimidazole carboxamide ribotide isomerase
MNFDIIPAIDLKEGQCVRLKQGRMEDATVYHKDPTVAAKKWLEAGSRRLHIVDLDGAFAGKPVNLDIIYQICRECPSLEIQIGGGIRQMQTIKDYLSVGVKYCILGTSAVKEPDFVAQASEDYPQQIILGVDAKDGWVALEGWDEASSLKASELILRFAKQPIAAVIYTDIQRDGMLQGVNLEATIELAQQSPFPIIASGGVKDSEDIRQILTAHPNIQGVIAGRALYSGDLVLSDTLELVSNTANTK